MAQILADRRDINFVLHEQFKVAPLTATGTSAYPKRGWTPGWEIDPRSGSSHLV
jgi:hypothetical protein